MGCLHYSQQIEHDTMEQIFMKRICSMISYEPLWRTLNQKDMSTYDLIYRHGLSANTVHRMKNGKDITTKTLNELCFILRCSISDIIEYRETEED